MYTKQQVAALESHLTENWPLRRSSSKWAGGDHKVTIALSDSPGADGGSEKVWSGNGKWSGTNSYARLSCTTAALSYFPTLRTADGTIVLDAKKIAPREFRLTWVEQSAGFSLKAENGWLIRGYHCTAPTIEQARKKEAKARVNALVATLAAREQRRVKQEELAHLRQVWIELADSIAGGNCRSASEQFAQTAYREIGANGPCAVRADIVLSMRDDMWTRRALAVAMKHTAPA
jgi:hypothetical protein